MAQYIQIVEMDVIFEGSDIGLDEDEAMLQLFAYQPAIQFKSGSTSKYQSGNYHALDADDVDVWLGELIVVRDAGEVHIDFDEEKGYTVVERATGEQQLIERRTLYAYIPKKQPSFELPHSTFLVWERSGLDYKKLETYARRASHQDRNNSIRLVPRPQPVGLRTQISRLSAVETLRLVYRHSQSPGNENVDHAIEWLNARKITTKVESERTSALNAEALTNPESDLREAQVVDHLDKNPKNGYAVVTGRFQDRKVKLDTRKPVLRHHIQVARLTIEAALEAMTILFNRILRRGPTTDEDTGTSDSSVYREEDGE